MAMAAASWRRVCPLRHLNPDMDRRRPPGMCDACSHMAWGSGNWGNRFSDVTNLEALPGSGYLTTWRWGPEYARTVTCTPEVVWPAWTGTGPVLPHRS